MHSDEYHKSDAIGSSMLRDFLKSPRLFEARHILRTAAGEPSDEMDLGTAAHAAILCDQPLDSVVMLIPPEVLSKSGSRAGNEWKDFAARNYGKVLLKQDDYNRMNAIRDAVFRNPAAKRLLEMPGPVESSIFWQCRDTDLRRKARLDKLAEPTVYMPIIVDVKTASDHSKWAWAKAALDRGYHIQAAYYADAVRHTRDVDSMMAFIVVSSKPPHVCRTYSLGDDELALGREQVRTGLERLAEALETNDWREPGEDVVTTICFPGWAFKTRTEHDEHGTTESTDEASG